MLHINTAFTRDPEANAFIREFINDRITSLLINDIEGAAGQNYLKVLPEDKEYQENIHFYFPDHYDRQDGATAFLNLLKGVKSKDDFIPNIYEEYALHAALHSYIHHCEDKGLSPARSMPQEARKYVINVLKNEYLTDERDEMDPDVRLATFEDLYDYDDFLTYNMDYAMLDHMTAEEIEAARKKK
ncbi:MAG TPA: hypothetical protein DD632_01010 [Oribacterium sp.]|nr:hypothetical protein [Oribacterium sp.]HCS67409.1 hypothetical protein [Oribacterium sp.]